MVRHDQRKHSINLSPTFKKSALALVVAAATHSAMAQQATQADGQITPAALEEVIVYGIRQSLQNAQDIKRNANTVKDVITASDIMSLPDKSVVDALKRIPGVQVEVFAATNDPEHFGAEGSTALVRGLSRTLTQFNGRTTFSARAGGGLDMSNIPAELLGGIEVSKNQTAEMIPGGIAGTLDLITRKPFDADGMQLAGSVKATYGDVIDDVQPELSGLFSNRWDTDLGEIGFLVSAATAKFTQRSEGVGAHNFYERRAATDAEIAAAPDANGNGVSDDPVDIQAHLQANGIGMPLTGQAADTTLWMPPTVQARFKEDARDRSGLAASLQWSNPGETVLATLEFIRSESDYVWHERLVQNTDSQGHELRNANVADIMTIEDPNGGGDLSSVEESFDSNGLFTHGFITNTATADGMYEAQTRWHGESSTVNDISLDVEWNVSDNLIVTSDLHYVDSEMRMRDHTIANGFQSDVWLDLRDPDAPQIAFVGMGFGPATNAAGETILTGNTEAITSGKKVNLRSAMDHDTHSVGESVALSADAEYHFDDSWITSVKGGVRFSDRDQTHKETNYDWGNISPEWDTGHFRSAADYPGFHEQVDFGSDFHDGDAFVGDGVTEFFFPRLSHVRNLNQFEAQINSMPGSGSDRTFVYTAADGNTEAIWVTQESDIVKGKAYGDPFAPNEIFQVSEQRNSAFAQLNFATASFLIPMRGNIGLRYVDVTTQSSGHATFNALEGAYIDADRYTDDTVVTGFPDPNWPNESDNLAAFLSGPDTSTTLTAEPKPFRTVLPSFNITFNLAEDVLLRFGASKAVFIPEVADLRNSLIVSPIVDALVTPADPDAEPDADVDGSDRPFQSVAFRGYEATSVGDSNPYLRPEESINLDVSAEWYFSDVGSLTFVVFSKDMKNLIRTAQVRENITNPSTGATGEAIVRGKANVGEATIQGSEFAYQQTFDFLPGRWSGLGTQFNYTFIDTEEEVGTSIDTTVFGSFTDLPLEGLSRHSYNAVLFYEADNYSTRLAYNWRSEYMLDDRDVIAARPVYNADRGELDFSFSYKLTDNITAGFDINNLLDQQTSTMLQYQQSGELTPRNYFVNDRRISLRLTGSF